jgi:hypothetical protein
LALFCEIIASMTRGSSAAVDATRANPDGAPKAQRFDSSRASAI